MAAYHRNATDEAKLRDIGQRLSAASAEIAAALCGDDASVAAECLDGGSVSAPDLLATAKTLLLAQQRISAFFHPTLFCDPARSMLLELFVAEEEGRCISISGLGHAIEIPGTTSLRWLSRLQEEGLVVIRAHAHDGRLRLVSLSESGCVSLRGYLTFVARQMALATGRLAVQKMQCKVDVRRAALTDPM